MAKKKTKEPKEETVVSGKEFSKEGAKSRRSEDSVKADRKFKKKLQFYSKVRETIAFLSAKKVIEKKNKNAKRRQKKLGVFDLSSLCKFLPELDEPQQTAPPKREVSRKSRQKLILKEAKQLRTVLSHPAFQSDPLAAIYQHLQSTQPAPEKKTVKKFRDNGKRKKKKKSISSTGPQSMET